MIEQLKVVVAADDFRVGYLAVLMAQLSERDINHELVHIQRPFCWKKKIKAWIDGLGNHHGKAVFLDAFDVLMFGGEQELYDKIKAPLIFSGDRVCWPAANAEPHYPKVDTPWRFVNSGCIAGYSDYLRGFLNTIHEEMLEVYPPGKLDCEQFNCTLHYLKGTGVIDRYCTIFHCLLKDDPKDLVPNGDRWINTQTGTLPVFVHGQGKSFKKRPDIFKPLDSYKDWNWYA